MYCEAGAGCCCCVAVGCSCCEAVGGGGAGELAGEGEANERRGGSEEAWLAGCDVAGGHAVAGGCWLLLLLLHCPGRPAARPGDASICNFGALAIGTASGDGDSDSSKRRQMADTNICDAM